MAIKALDQKKRQKILLFVALGIFLVTAIVMYIGFFKPQSVSTTTDDFSNNAANPTSTPKTTTPAVSQNKLKQINLDFDFLNNTILPLLKKHGKIPVEVDKNNLGRDNPFIPY